MDGSVMILKRMTVLIVLLVFGLSSPAVAGVSTDDFQDFSEIGLEELLNQVVVTASRYSQKVSESPSTVTVITAEEIRASSATSIPELLRMVPGMEMFAGTASDYNVSARGFNDLLSNMMLVMIDGRTIYQDFYGMILWESLPIVLEEIATIEIIRGPGSAMYGANAFNGVVNIITKRPEEIKKTLLTVEGGEGDFYRSSMVHAGQLGANRYKISAGSKGANSWVDVDDYSNSQVTLVGAISRELNESSEISVEGGITDGLIEMYPDGSVGLVDVKLRSGGVNYLRANYQAGDFSLQLFRNHLCADLIPQDASSILPFSQIREEVFDLDLQHSLSIGARHRLVWGANYRSSMVEWNLLQKTHSRDLASCFVHDEFKPNDNWIFYLGGRYDHHPHTGDQVSPRGGLIFIPRENHALRMSLGTAFRNPTEMEVHFYLAKPVAPGIDYVSQGSEDLDSEKITSFEIGYRAPFAKSLIGEVTLFANQVEELIDFETTRYIGDGIPIESTFANGDKVDVFGGEVAFDLLFSERLKFKANYSYLHMMDGVADTTLTSSPEHRFNLNMDCQLMPKLQLNLNYHLVSEYNLTWNVVTTQVYGRVPASGLVNGKLMYRLSDDRFSVWVAGYNLLDNVHRQHPSTEEVRRRLYIGLQVGL
jgi:iron complex outermembrane recepter protein